MILSARTYPRVTAATTDRSSQHRIATGARRDMAVGNRFRFLQAVAFAVALFAAVGSASAEEIKLAQAGGPTLNGELILADGKTIRDGVVLLTHGTLAHNRMEIIEVLQRQLRDNGLNSLAINLSFGVDDRAGGMFDCALPQHHRHSDGPVEIGAWVEWLKSQGVDRIALVGHSRGGNQTAWYAAEHIDAAVKAVALIAPMLGDDARVAAEYQAAHGRPLASVLAEARAKLASGGGDDWLPDAGFLYCPHARVSAASFLDYYGPDPRKDTPTLLPRVAAPVLVIAAGADETVRGIPEAVRPVADGNRVTLKVIAGADHYFRDLYADDLTDAVVEFLGRTGVRS